MPMNKNTNSKIPKPISYICEDFVSSCCTISYCQFLIGLKNGKLIQFSFDKNIKIKIERYIQCHHDRINSIEINKRLGLIITSGNDNLILIRKLYDFELLTAINLTYCFANPIISEKCNIFPSLVKISELNLLYVVIYDLDSNTNFIRGYNLNGLFISQTDQVFFILGKQKLIINSISFTKNSNLIIGFYNTNNYSSLNAWDLTPNCLLRLLDISEKKDKIGTQMITFDYSSNLFYLLYENEFVIKPAAKEDRLEYN
jgi:hypothetical protein